MIDLGGDRLDADLIQTGRALIGSGQRRALIEEALPARRALERG